ncbi:MAG: hypothetical protein ACOYMF_05555 [Bacteroidales bacterium]
MLHLSKARKLIESHDPLDISFWTRKGEIIHAHNVVCTSSFFHGNTFNIKFLDSGEFRKVKALLIFNVSGEEVYV